MPDGLYEHDALAWAEQQATVAKPNRIPGQLAGKFTIPPGFDDPLPDTILDAFEGR